MISKLSGVLNFSEEKDYSQMKTFTTAANFSRNRHLSSFTLRPDCAILKKTKSRGPIQTLKATVSKSKVKVHDIFWMEQIWLVWMG